MKLAKYFKRIRCPGEPLGAMLRNVTPRLLLGASVGLCLGIGAVNTAKADVGRVRVDYIAPTLANDQLLGTFQFPSPGGRADAQFAECQPNVNCLDLELTSGGFIINSIVPGTINISSNVQAIIKLTFLDTNDITDVARGPSSNFSLPLNAILFGDNFAQVQLAGSTIGGGGLFEFPMTFGNGVTEPVPAPPSLSLLAFGLAAFTFVRVTTKRSKQQPA